MHQIDLEFSRKKGLPGSGRQHWRKWSDPGEGVGVENCAEGGKKDEVDQQPVPVCPVRVAWVLNFVRDPYFNSTFQYAASRNDFQDWYFLWVNFRFNSGLRLGFSGLRIRLM
jgi:hypothetical protein